MFLINIMFLFSSFFSLVKQHNEPCAFCNAAVIEKQKFYEDDHVMVLYTHKPMVPGHCLIIPKRHAERFENVAADEFVHMAQAIRKVHAAMQEVFHTSSYLLLQKNGHEVGQTVPHVHIHYIPRKRGENSSLALLFRMYWAAYCARPLPQEEMNGIVLALQHALAHPSSGTRIEESRPCLQGI